MIKIERELRSMNVMFIPLSRSVDFHKNSASRPPKPEVLSPVPLQQLPKHRPQFPVLGTQSRAKSEVTWSYAGSKLTAAKI